MALPIQVWNREFIRYVQLRKLRRKTKLQARKVINFRRKALNINNQIYFLSLGIAAAIAPTRDLVCVGKMVIFFLTTGTA